MSGLIWLLSVSAYAATWLTAAVAATRFCAAHEGRAHCHGEGGGYIWTDRSYCNRHCRSGCWRTDEPIGVTPRTALTSSALALAWPVLLVPAVAFVFAKRGFGPTADLAAIARMEKELGIGKDAA